MKYKKTILDRYEKKENCAYPFSPESLGYCWGYALAKDSGKNDAEIEKDLCKKYRCECYIRKNK